MRTPDDAAARLIAAMQAVEAAHLERDQAVADALKAGGSVREVAMIAGMSPTTVQKIGHANGWPTPAMKRQWEAEKARRDQWDSIIDEYRRTHGSG